MECVDVDLAGAVERALGSAPVASSRVHGDDAGTGVIAAIDVVCDFLRLGGNRGVLFFAGHAPGRGDRDDHFARCHGVFLLGDQSAPRILQSKAKFGYDRYSDFLERLQQARRCVEARLLEYFLRVVELGSINRAAAELRLSQPSLSRWLSLLEREIGSALLIRTKQGIRTTDAGQVLVERVQPVLRQLQLLRDEIGKKATSQVTLGLAEFSGQKSLHKVPGHHGPHDPATQTNNVHMIILDSLPSREVIVDQSSADSRNFVDAD